MVFRLTWLASLALIGLVILRLNRLFLSTENGLPWQIVTILAAAIGLTVTWAVMKARLGTVFLLATHLLLFGLFAFVYVGGELSDSAIPPVTAVGDIFTEVSDAVTIFRFAAPPVTPLAGIVALAALMVWALSAVAAWGLLNNSPYLSIVPPVVFYLQLAVVDRQSTGLVWTTALLLLVGTGLATIASDQRAVGGYAGHGRQSARIRAIAVPVLAIITVTAVSVLASRQAVRADAVPASGILDWRNRSGIGGGIGSVSYNPFIDVQRSLVSSSEQPVFAARVTSDLPNNQVYWRLLTMDTFNGDWWYASQDDLEELDETSWEDDAYEFRGTTVPTIQDVTILDLNSTWLPAAYSPVGVFSEERIIANTTRVDALDGSLHIDGVTRRGMTYRVSSLIPDVDNAVLSGDEDGRLSPLFAAAAAEGRFQPRPAPSAAIDRPSDLDRYLQLPRGVDSTGFLTRLAEDITFGLETDYEKALALEHYFRNPTPPTGTPATDGFTYSINVPPNERDTGLTDWLVNPDSPGYHTGYCEQFSASMGVLARLLDIPTRTVLGFTPGEVRSDGTVLVRDRNAHAWVEVWLPTQGWVRFDPTPRGDRINPTTFERTGFSSGDLDRYFTEIADAVRAAEGTPGGGAGSPFRDPDLENPDRFAAPGEGTTESTGFSIPSWLTATALWGSVAAVALGLVPGLKRRRRRRRLRRLHDGDVGAAWAEIVDRLIDSGINMNSADTPLEVAVTTEAAMQPLAEVYSESVYGNQESVPVESRTSAADSLTTTEQRLRERESPWQRMRRVYRVKSLLPDWVKRAASRRR